MNENIKEQFQKVRKLLNAVEAYKDLGANFGASLGIIELEKEVAVLINLLN